MVPLRLIARVTVITAVAGPVVLLGSGMIASNPDYQGFGFVLGLVALIAALGVVAGVGGRWLLLPTVLSGAACLFLAATAFQFQVLEHRGMPTDVVVTAVHTGHGRQGTSYSCDIRRADGGPLPHGVLHGSFCSGRSELGSTENVVVDPAGWVPPLRPEEVQQMGWTASTLAAGLVAVFALSVGLSGWRGLRATRKAA